MKRLTTMIAYSPIASHPFTFDAEKALEVVLYIANRAKISDLIHICKVLYFADKMHLEEYGRFICGDCYIAMTNGPVPSGTYDIIKSVRSGQAQLPLAVHGGYQVKALRDADLMMLSESDVESLDKAISQYGGMPVGKLIEVSHDEAWQAADENSMIAVENIAATLRDGEAIIDHIRHHE